MFTKGQKVVITYQVHPDIWELRKATIEHHSRDDKNARTGTVTVRTPDGHIHRHMQTDICRDTPSCRKIAKKMIAWHHGRSRKTTQTQKQH